MTRTEGADFPTPLELVVAEEPPVLDAASLPEGVTGSIAWQAPPKGRTPGPSPAAARSPSRPRSPPAAYRGTIVPGEVQSFAVDVGWGQQLAATMSIAKPSGRLARSCPSRDRRSGWPSTTPIGPTQSRWPTGGPAHSSTIYPTGGGRVGATTAPVAYRNREIVGDPIRAASAAGTYTIVLSLADSRARTSYEVPFVLASA